MRKLFLFLLIPAVINSSLMAKRIFVALDGDNSDGSSWGKGYNALNTAILNSVSGDTIFVKKGIYRHPAGTNTTYFAPVSGTVLLGGFDGTEDVRFFNLAARDFNLNETVLSADNSGNDAGFTNRSDNSYHVLYIQGKTQVIIDGFRLKGANGTTSTAETGKGGGIFISASSDISIRNTIVDSNYCYEGAGIFANGSAITLSNILVFGNQSGRDGAGIFIETNGVKIFNATIANNTIGTSFYDGAGIFSDWNVQAKIYNTICADNYPDQCYSDGSSVKSAYFNCLIRGNGESGNFNSVAGYDSLGNIDVDPMFVNPQTGLYSLFENSEAIGAGLPVYGSNIGYYQDAGIAMPSPIYVSATATGLDNGTSWANAYNDLNDALNSAGRYTPIYVAQGVYKPHPVSRDSSFNFKVEVLLYGGFKGDEMAIDELTIKNRDLFSHRSVISGDISDNDVKLSNQTENTLNLIKITGVNNIRIDGFVFKGANQNALYLESDITVANCQFYHNYGRAVYSRYGYSEIINSTFAENQGNGIYVYNGNPILVNCIMMSSVEGFFSKPGFRYSNIQYSGGSENWLLGAEADDLGNNIDLDPAFVSADSVDFRLLLNSPCIGSGDTNYAQNMGFYQGAPLIRKSFFLGKNIETFDKTKPGTFSEPDSTHLYGMLLTSDVMVVATARYKVSLTRNPLNAVDTLIITPGSGRIDTTLYVFFAPVDYSGTSGNISYLSAEFSTKQQTLSAQLLYPVIEFGPESIIFGSTVIGTVPPAKKFTFWGKDMDDDLTLVSYYGYKISFDSLNYFDTLYVPRVFDSIPLTTIFVKFMPMTTFSYNGTIGFISANLTGANKGVSGSGAIPVRHQRMYVKQSATGANTGESWINAFTHLQSALSAAIAGDTIFVAKGQYITHYNNRSISFTYKEGVVVLGSFSGTEIIDSTVIADRNFYQNASFLNGDIYMDDSTTGTANNAYHIWKVVLSGTSITSNTVWDGFYVVGANCLAESGSPNFHGGGLLVNVTNASSKFEGVFRNIVFNFNMANMGGAVCLYINNNAGIINATFKNVEFRSNTSTNGGGALFVHSYVGKNTSVFDNCRFTNNEVTVINYFGGAIYTNATGGGRNDLKIINSIFNQNKTVNTSYKCIYATSGSPYSGGTSRLHIINSTFYGHTGYSLVTSEGTSSYDTVNMTNVIMYNTSAAAEYFKYNGKGVINTDHCMIRNIAGSGGIAPFNINPVDPLFLEPSLGYFQLKPGSHCLDSGNILYGKNIGWYQDDAVTGTPDIDIFAISSLSFGTVTVGEVSKLKTFKVAGYDLFADLTITADPEIGIGLDSNSIVFGGTILITPLSGEVDTSMIYVRYKPLAGTTDTMEISLSSPGAITNKLVYTGKGEYPVLEQQLFSSPLLSVYPNPFKEYLIINSSEKFWYELINISGFSFASGFSEGRVYLNTFDCSSGMYILMIKTERGLMAYKVIKQ